MTSTLSILDFFKKCTKLKDMLKLIFIAIHNYDEEVKNVRSI